MASTTYGKRGSTEEQICEFYSVAFEALLIVLIEAKNNSEQTDNENFSKPRPGTKDLPPRE